MSDLEYLKKYGNPEKFSQDVKRLERGEPVQYIVGNVDFYGNLIEVNKDVLIPRFETEELVDRVIRYYKKEQRIPQRILDLGTGSGCIAITLKKAFPDAQVTAVDISSKALAVARKNAQRNGVSIRLLEGNFLEPVEGTFDLIISNPPYIDFEEQIDEKVRKYEPSIALYADHNGLSCYEHILKHIEKYTEDNSLIVFEIGYLQKKSLMNLVKEHFPNKIVWCEKDLSGKDRFLWIMDKRC